MHNSYLIKKKYIQPYKQQAMHFNTTPLTQNQLLALLKAGQSLAF